MESYHKCLEEHRDNFSWAGRLFIQPQPVTLFGESIQWVDTSLYLAAALDNGSPGRLTSIRSERKLLKGWVCWVPSWTGEVISPSGTESCYTSSSSALWWIMCAPLGGPLFSPRREAAGVTIQESSPCCGCPLVRQ